MQYRPALHGTARILQEHNDSVKVQMVLREPRLAKNVAVFVVGIQLILQYCKYRLTLGTRNCCMTISTMHTIHTWLASSTRDTGYELVLSYPPPPLSQVHTVFTCTHPRKLSFVVVINVSTT